MQGFLNPFCGRVRAPKHAPRGRCCLLEHRLGLADVVERGAGLRKGTYAGCYSGRSRVADRTHAIFDALPFVKQCRRRLERLVGDVHLFDLNATDLRVKDAPPPPRRPKKGPGDIRRDRAMHHLKKVGKKKGVPKE